MPVTDDEAVEAFEYLSRTEGVIPALKLHAVAYAMKLAPTLAKDKTLVICLSGRGDKDVAAVRYKGVEILDRYLGAFARKSLYSSSPQAIRR